MKTYILDTHTFIHALVAPEKLGRVAAKALHTVEAGKAVAFIPAAVLAEIALLHERGRIVIGISEAKAAMEASSGLRFLPMDMRQIEEFAAHSQIHEPFDRFILAAARTCSAILISRDSMLAESGLIKMIWD